MRAERPHPAELALPDRPILSPVARAELFTATLALVSALYLLPAAKAWIHARAEAVQTSALGECRPPSEFEQLHVVVENRAGRLVAGGCLFVGTPGTYAR